MEASLPAKYLVTSVSLHVLLVVFLFLLQRPPHQLEQEPTFSVETIPSSLFEQTVRPQKKQIVSPPQNPETAKAPERAFDSDKNREVKKETIKRGEQEQNARQPSPQPQTEKKSPPVSPQKKAAEPSRKAPRLASSSPKASMKQPRAEGSQTKSTAATQIAKSSKPTELKYLTLDKQQTLSQFGAQERNKKSQPAGGSPSSGGDYRAFSRPPGSGAAFQGAFGTQDYLPNLPDGDLTLLNTKASTYAVFVRRVALRVFQALKQSGWESLTAHEIQQIATNVFIQAKLSRDGKLLSVSVQSSSGSRNYDESVKKAVARAASDPHPPAGAEAADGTITFIFASRTWARMQVNPRTKAPFEQRWIFLGTGLE